MANKNIITLFSLVILFTISCKPTKVDLLQFQDWTIVVDDDAILSERYAAEEFQSIFLQVTGINLPIANIPPKPTHNIFIGSGKEMAASNVGFGTEDLGEEDLHIRINRENIAIAGGRPRGTLYGAYEFVERYLGVRFLTYDHTYIPKVKDKLIVPCENYSYRPTFLFRWSYYGENKAHPEFAARLRINTVTQDEKLGGMTSQRLISHSLNRQLPVAKYGKEHPEYFALVKGKRELDMWGGGPEPCVTNPDVIDIVTEAVFKQIEENPHFTNISVSQNDNDAYCRCETCEAINQREGSPMGAHLAFVNTIAERVAQKYPDVKVGTLAYWYTRKPPKTIKPRDNVQIQLANIECCTLHPIDDPNCPKNKSFYEDFMGWSKISDQIYIWTYVTNFRYYDLPFPNLRAIGPNIKFFANHNVKGVFMQSNGGGTSGEMSDLRNYVISRCLWHPELDAWDQVEEFCRLHYGKAAPVILEYLTMLHDDVDANGHHPDCFSKPRDIGLNLEFAKKMFDYFEQALSLAEDEVIRNRVEKISIAAYRTMLEAGRRIEVENGMVKRKFPPKYGDVIERYIQLCHKHQMTMPDERTRFEEFEQVLRNDYARGIPVAVMENDTWRLAIDYRNNGKVVEMLHKPSGRNLLGAFKNNFMYGTIEEWGEQGYDHEAEPNDFQAKIVDNSVLLTQILPDGSSYERKLSLQEDEPQKIFCETTLTHRGKTPKTYQLIVHPEFDTGTNSSDHNMLSGYVKYHNEWVIFNEGLVNDQGPKTRLLIDAKDSGEYAFFNHEGNFGILETYNPAKIDRLRTWWVPGFELFNLELLTKAVELKSGESFSFTYAFEYLDKAPK
jgi:hypothetical protein